MEDTGAAVRDSQETRDSITMENLARLLRKELELRKSYFGKIAFGGYSLNILLTLLSINGEDRNPSVTEMATLGNMSPTTGLRWIEVLHEKGFIKIAHNDDDPRGKSVMLTQRGKADMHSYLGSVAKMRELALV